MSSSARPQRDGGFVATLMLLFAAMIVIVLLLAWVQRQRTATRQVEQHLQIRLNRELAREMERLDSTIVAAPGEPTSQPLRQALLVEALHNLQQRGREERLILERHRQRLQRLSRNSTGARRRQVRDELRKLAPELYATRAWVDLLEARILQARGLRAPPFSPPAAADTLPAGVVRSDPAAL